jgi:hypothetical protein
MTAPSGIALKSLAGLLQKRRSQREVVLGSRQILMPKVGRQTRQQVLKVGARSIPSDEPVDGRGVSQVVEPRLITGTTVAGDLRPRAQKPQRSLDRRARQALTIAAAEERTGRHRVVASVATTTIIDQHSGQVPTQRHEPRLEKLGLPDRENRLVQINITDVKLDSLAQAQSGSVEE